MSTVRALDMLTDTYPPLLRRRAPYWRPTPAPVWESVREPAWSWQDPRVGRRGAWPWLTENGAPAPLYVLDANAAYLAAASTVEVAHGRLTRVLGGREFCPRWAGYWLVDAHPWTHPWIMSPLGTAQLSGRVWLTTPTVALLAQLVEDGHWPGVDVYDCWIGEPCRLRHWATALRDLRLQVLDSGDEQAYSDFKVAYSQAVTTMQVDRRSKLYRPDWAQHIRAQHAATMWRKAWLSTLAGHPIIAAGRVDELVLTERSMAHYQREVARGARPPIRIDNTGRDLGTFKVKANVRTWEDLR